MADDKIATIENAVLGPAPDYIPKSRRGFQDTTQSDLMIPRLVLAQALHPQVTDGDPLRIEGLIAGEFFNSVTRQRYGKEVLVQILRKMPLRAMEFRSVDEGGGVIDPDVPIGDPRLRWGTSGDKKADKPQATLFRDFIAVILPQREMIALSFKSSGITAAKNLWGLATMGNRDCFSICFRLTSDTKLTPKPHKIYKVSQVGWVTKTDMQLGEEMYEAVQTIDATKIDRSGDNDDIDDSMAANPEGAASEM